MKKIRKMAKKPRTTTRNLHAAARKSTMVNAQSICNIQITLSRKAEYDSESKSS